MNVSKKYILSRVNSTIWCTRQAKHSDRKLRIESGGNEIPEEVLNP